MDEPELTLEGKFLDHQALGLTEPQYCGLVKTLAWLEAGKLDHKNDKIARFDMRRWGGNAVLSVALEAPQRFLVIAACLATRPRIRENCIRFSIQMKLEVT